MKKIGVGVQPGHEELIVNRIKESSRSYTREEQRAELLFRNPSFKKDLAGVLRLVSKAKGLRGSSNRDGVDYIFEYWKSKAEMRFWQFCTRWQIYENWNLNQDVLSRFVKMEPGLLYGSLKAGGWNSQTPYPGTDSDNFIYLRIEPWTKLEDVKALWRKVEKLKKDIFGYSEKDKDGFGNSLCWYDLRHEYELSPLRIARLWIRCAAPYIQDEASYKITVREGIKRIERYIERLTPIDRHAKRPVAK
jgi:hypothetical protein